MAIGPTRSRRGGGASWAGGSEWVKLAPFPEPAEELYGVAAGGRLYVFGGRLGAAFIGVASNTDVVELSGAGTRDLGVEVEKRILIDATGRVIGERPLRQILTSWDRSASAHAARRVLAHMAQIIEAWREHCG